MTSSGRVDLTTLRERAEAATPGPWEVVRYEDDGTESAFVGMSAEPVSGRWFDTDSTSLSLADASYLAALSPDVVLALVEAVEAAREAVIVDSIPGHPDDQNREIQARAKRLRAALVPFAAAVSESTT